MTELDSSLCQLNWLIAKEGIGSTGYKEQVEPPAYEPPAQVSVPKPQTSPKPRGGKRHRRVFQSPEKPPYSYSQLIRLAINNTADKRCTLAEIYGYVSKHFPFYRENRNSSWKNSIRHNLSLNKQFARVEKVDGEKKEKGGWWICVEPPEKKPRILKGEPVRVNPIYEQIYLQNQKPPTPDQPLFEGEEIPADAIGEFEELTEQEIRELNLFESHDLNSSFRVVYDQIFEKQPSPDEQQEAAQIDWLKISLETAGIDYEDELEMSELDTAKLKDYVHNGFPTDSENDGSTSNYFSPVDSVQSATLRTESNEDSDDDFDWNSLL